VRACVCVWGGRGWVHSMYYIYSFMNGIFLRVKGALSLLLNMKGPIQLHCMICDETIKNTATWEVNFDVGQSQKQECY